MSQIIKHRRGSLESLSAVTSSLQKGELVIASGSSNLTVTNGASIVFAVPANGQVQAINRILVGDAAPNTFAAGTYNGMLKGVPYYASGSSTLYLLGEGANDIPDLTGNITTFSSSVASAINALSSSIGGGSIGTSVAALNTFSGSTLVSLGELNSFTSSQLTQNSALATYTGSVETRLTEVGVVSGSLIASASAAKTTNDSQDVSISNLNSFTQSFSQSVATDFSASNASINSLSASVASVTGDFSSSVATSFSASAVSQTLLSASIATTFLNVSGAQSTQDNRLDSIEAVGLTYATTGSNIFKGNQTITGSMYITNDLVVYGSSSLFNVTASVLDIGQNTIVLNTATPAVRFGGLTVADSGSTQGASGSLLWDSLNNNWLYQHPSGGGESGQTAILISGPRNSGSMGDETHLTPGKIMVAVGDDHIGDSIITQATDNSKVDINGGLGVSGSIIVDGDIVGVGSIFLQPDIDDTRKLEIYNTSAADVHIKGTGGLTFLGDDTNYVKIDDSLQTVTVVGVNGVFIETELNVTGPISASAGFSGSIAGIGNVSAYSQSVSASLAAIVANVGSGVGVSIDNLNTFSSSTLIRLTDLEAFDSTADTRLSNIETTSASVNTSVAALNSSSASQQTQLDSLSAKTGSYATTGSNVFVGTQTISGSFNVSGSSNFGGAVAVDNSNMNLTNSSSLNLTNGSSIYVNGNGVISGSIVGIGNVTAFSTSVDSRLNSLNSSTASQQISIDALNAYTSSNTSTNALNAFTASADARFTEIGVVSGSLIASASAAKSTNDTQDGRLTNLEATSASVNTSVSNLNSKSASVDVSIANINSFTSSFGTTFSSSVDSRLDTLEGTGTIQGVGTTNDVTFNKVTTTGDVIVGGDLVVQGNTVTLNTAQLVVEDKIITLASGSTSNATADGAGFEIAGTTASFKYDGTANQFSSSVAVVANVTGSINIPGAGSSKRLTFRNAVGNIDFIAAPSNVGDIAQWDGTDFVMSNVIDGGSF